MSLSKTDLSFDEHFAMSADKKLQEKKTVKEMNKPPKNIFKFGVAAFLIMLTIGTYHSEAGEIITGITALYVGSIFLYDGIKGNAPDWGAVRLRFIAGGTMAIIIGIVYIVQFFLE